MFDKKSMKKEAIKHLMEMLEKDKDECEMDECDMEDGDHKPKMKATIVADSKEGLMEGAKKLPEVLSKSEKYMKERMDEIKKKKK